MSARSDSWEDLSRHEALALGSNEKLAPLNVRKSIVAVKAFPSRPIYLTTGKINLPLGANIMISHNDLHITDAHSSIVLIENWEAFERIHHLSFPVPVHLESALLIYRGDVGVLPTEATHDWLRSHNIPVYVFSDQDPSGLVIAMTAPNFTGLMFPPHADLEEAFSAGKGDRKRYLEQIVSCNDLLSTCENAEISSYFNIIRDAGRALPQEEFVRSKS
jgi:hypothetical protein